MYVGSRTTGFWDSSCSPLPSFIFVSLPVVAIVSSVKLHGMLQMFILKGQHYATENKAEIDENTMGLQFTSPYG